MVLKEKIILDTNVLVAAGFNRSSSAGRIIQAIEDGQIEMVWNEATRREARQVLQQIPPLSWDRIEALFKRRSEFKGETPGSFPLVHDPDDRKYAALAAASGATLITNDNDLLRVRASLDTGVMTPKEFMEHWTAINAQ
jgi:putative PIN family toxin of toxin-antitoxin system